MLDAASGGASIRAMAMMKGPAAATPHDYAEALAGWQSECVQTLRDAVRSAADFDERIKWGHIVYYANGPVLLIRAEAERVLFGFWRGKRLRHLDSRLKPGGKYEMATITFRKDDAVDREAAIRLVAEARQLNATLGDPTLKT